MKIGAAVFFLLCCPVYGHAQDFALKQLSDSPRHQEWVEVPSEGRTIHSFVVYPENAKNSLAVIVIHENRGLTDWVRSFADQLAAAGYLAIAPDLLSGFDSSHSRTKDFKNSDDAQNAIYQLDSNRITSDLLAVQKYIAQVPSSNGKAVVVGFCWGGGQAFRFATHSADLSAALVFYGEAPTEEERIRSISAAVYAFYGENDQRINATIPETEKRMGQHKKIYKYEIYPGAGHGFMRTGDDPSGSPEDKKARDEAWTRIKQILSQIL